MGKRRKPAAKIAAAGAPAAAEAPADEDMLFSGEDGEGDFASFSKMGFICFEEITGEEAEKFLQQAQPKKAKVGDTKVEKAKVEKAQAETAKAEKAKAEKAKAEKDKAEKAKVEKAKVELPAQQAQGAKKTDTAKAAAPPAKLNKAEERAVAKRAADALLAAVCLEPGDLPAWRKYPLDDAVLLGLKRQGFAQPTAIQEQTLQAFFGSPADILGSAPTGSGKTLAFGLPILDYIARQQDRPLGLAAMVIVPTRELAMQIRDHLARAAAFPLRLAILIGGMSGEKQARLLARDPHIVIGTPGRLAECLERDKELEAKVARLPFLVVDEADRLVEAGHFKELDAILAAVYRQPAFTARRTLLFSATLDFDSAPVAGGRRSENPLERLRAKVRFCPGAPPTVLSLGTKHRVADRLAISKIYCVPEEKDLFLVYYLLQSAARKTLVFVNSIDILKRVAPVLEVFGIATTSLHAQMQQRQRLQHLDKFRDAERMVLVTSDVSARGLDIPAVELVVHYHLPPGCDTFVHRSGRTARAQRSGTSLSLVAPQELPLETAITKKLALPGGELPAFPADLQAVERLRELVDLARQIETLQGQLSKATKEQSWAAKAAEDLGIDLDDEDGAAPGRRHKHRAGEDDAGSAGRQQKARLAALRAAFARRRAALRL